MSFQKPLLEGLFSGLGMEGSGNKAAMPFLNHRAKAWVGLARRRPADEPAIGTEIRNLQSGWRTVPLKPFGVSQGIWLQVNERRRVSFSR